MFSEKKYANLVWALFFLSFFLLFHLAVSKMQQQCTIVQQCVQSTYTQPAYALQTCMQGTYMCSWDPYTMYCTFASTTSLSTTFFPRPQKLSIDFLISHIHKTVEVARSTSCQHACAHALIFSKMFREHLSKVPFHDVFPLHPKNLQNLLAEGDVHQTQVNRCFLCCSSRVSTT